MSKLYKKHEVNFLDTLADISPNGMCGSSNTHAQNTQTEKKGLNAQNTDSFNGSFYSALDWFSCTFDKEEHNINDVFELLLKHLDLPFYSSIKQVQKDDNDHMTDWKVDTAIENGYYSSLSYENIAIFFNDYGNNDKGYKLRFSGSGCRDAELLFKEGSNWIVFIKDILSMNTNITRLDIAIDDKQGHFTIKDLFQKWQDDRIVSRYKNIRYHGTGTINGAKNRGLTLSFGDNKSRKQIVFYEKNHERANKLQDEELRNQVWNRTEVRYRAENAQIIAQEIIKHEQPEMAFSLLAMGTVTDSIKVCNENQTTINRSKWTVTDWWATYVQHAKKVKLYSPSRDTDIETKKVWINKQIPKTITSIIQAQSKIDLTNPDITHEDIENEAKNYITGLYYKGLSNLSKKDKELIKQYRDNKIEKIKNRSGKRLDVKL